MEIIDEEKLHLIYTTDEAWQERAKTKFKMQSKGYKIHEEYVDTGLSDVVTVFSKKI